MSKDKDRKFIRRRGGREDSKKSKTKKLNHRCRRCVGRLSCRGQRPGRCGGPWIHYDYTPTGLSTFIRSKPGKNQM